MNNVEKYMANDEVLAVIMAAVASMDVKPGHKLVVRSMRRVPQNSPVWNSAGRVERLRRNLNS
jgi:hypothetical protein